jgi:hypothetical protein
MKYPRTTLSTILKTLALVFTTAVCAHAQTLITFDDASEGTISNGYAGLNWNNFGVLNISKTVAGGYINGIISTPNIAFNDNGFPASFSSPTPFTLNSAYLTAAWNNGLNVEVQGFLNGKLAYDNTYIVNTTGPILENFNYAGVTSVTFTSSGGTPAGYLGSGEHFAMDNMTITPTPEPQTWALFVIGFLFVGWVGRKRFLTSK